MPFWAIDSRFCSPLRDGSMADGGRVVGTAGGRSRGDGQRHAAHAATSRGTGDAGGAHGDHAPGAVHDLAHAGVALLGVINTLGFAFEALAQLPELFRGLLCADAAVLQPGLDLLDGVLGVADVLVLIVTVAVVEELAAEVQRFLNAGLAFRALSVVGFELIDLVVELFELARYAGGIHGRYLFNNDAADIERHHTFFKLKRTMPQRTRTVLSNTLPSCCARSFPEEA
jgi:hypothetical protein